MDFPETLLLVIKQMNDYMKDFVVVEILDKTMTRKYPNVHQTIGYLGVNILVKCNKKEYKVFLKYQDVEDMLMYKDMLDNYLFTILKDELKQILKNFERKEKLKKINE